MATFWRNLLKGRARAAAPSRAAPWDPFEVLGVPREFDMVGYTTDDPRLIRAALGAEAARRVARRR